MCATIGNQPFADPSPTNFSRSDKNKTQSHVPSPTIHSIHGNIYPEEGRDTETVRGEQSFCPLQNNHIWLPVDLFFASILFDIQLFSIFESDSFSFVTFDARHRRRENKMGENQMAMTTWTNTATTQLISYTWCKPWRQQRTHIPCNGNRKQQLSAPQFFI